MVKLPCITADSQNAQPRECWMKLTMQPGRKRRENVKARGGLQGPLPVALRAEMAGG